MTSKLVAGLAAGMIALSAYAVAPSEAAPNTKCKRVSCPITTNVIGLKGARYKFKNTAVRISSKRKVQRREAQVLPKARQQVVAMIKQMAPSYGVPTWFALRIAKVESGYNPRARGAAGEYGVFQLKCATARLIGYRGNCRGLANASTNIQYGLKHLQLAVRSSRGNLKLAASKHNGGLGRKSLVRAYVRRVF
jgi:soluble lytic murein transglycosylase-like protein